MLVLRTLLTGPRHGYAIARHLHAASGAFIQVEEGSLYPALHRLERRGLIEAEWGPSEANRRAKYYSITRSGRSARGPDVGLAGNATGDQQHHELSTGGDMSMPWNELWHYAARRFDRRGAATTHDEVGDELMFHFRKLVDEGLSEGLSFDAAWEKAEQQFGPMRRYHDECRAGQLAHRGKWRKLAAVAVVTVAFISGWSFVESCRPNEKGDVPSLREEVARLRHAQEAGRAAAGSGESPRRIAGGFDLTGTILDNNDHPLEQATVLIVRKTWPGGGYRQEAFTATTNDDGHFRLPEFVPADDQYAIQVAALKEGFAFQSAYQLKDKLPIEKPDPIFLRLERAAPVTLVVRAVNGEPIANARVIPSARTPPGGKDEFIYFLGSEQVQKTTDAEGRVHLNYFLSGDRAMVYLKLPGDHWGPREFEISGENQVVDLTPSSTAGG